MEVTQIQNRIYELRGEKVMLDFDLARLYEVETRTFNQAIKRNLESFPKDFMFQLTAKEWKEISSSQNVMMGDSEKSNSSQIVMSSLKHRGSKYLPYAFTEHGVTMAASVLKSPKARKMNIAIVRAFIALRKLAIKSSDVLSLLLEMRSRIDEHDVQLNSIYDTIENLLDKKMNEIAWKNRQRIGFKK
jgi:hypothetical protein